MVGSSEFAIHKLKVAGNQPGLYLLRRSPQDFDSFLLTICAQVRLALTLALTPVGGWQHLASVLGAVGSVGMGRKTQAETWHSLGWCPQWGALWDGQGGCCGHPWGWGGRWGCPVVLTLALPPQTHRGPDYRRCQIRRDQEGTFWLSGVPRRFCSLQELLGTYGHCGLQAEGARMRLAACCPPLPRGEAVERVAAGHGLGR